MNISKIALPIVFSICAGLIGCDSRTEWSSSDYVVYWIDYPDNRMLGRKLDSGNFIGRVEATVTAVGADDNWVVAARRNTNGDVYFYYIKISQDSDFKNGSDVVKGPFERIEFESIKAKLNLPDFDKQF